MRRQKNFIVLTSRNEVDVTDFCFSLWQKRQIFFDMTSLMMTHLKICLFMSHFSFFPNYTKAYHCCWFKIV